MAHSNGNGQLTAGDVLGIVARVLAPERAFYGLVVVYGLSISLLTLATPIAVQVLINTVAYTGLTSPLVILSLTLLALLLAAGLLNALRVHLMEIFGRRFYARLTSEIALKTIYARNPFFADDGRDPLFNRYFDIFTVQKNVPVLFIGGFTAVLQVVVGFALTSFYHPLLLAFNVVVVLLIWLVWGIWGGGAVTSAVTLSAVKHKGAAWLEGVAGSNGFFKTETHVKHALDRTEDATASYVDAHKRHFRSHFAQTVSFYMIYAAASAALLGLGGWLVIQGQLSLGQLVAAELVLSAAFFGITQFGSYLNYFYDLCAACEELSLFETIEQEEPIDAEMPRRIDSTLSFHGVRGDARGKPAELNFELPSGATVQAAARHYGVQRLFTQLLKRFVEPRSGTLTIGGDDISVTEPYILRRDVIVLDRPHLVEMTIRRYLSLTREGVTSAEMLAALRAVGLVSVIEDLEEGLDTELAPTGWPLSISEVMELKLAAAILARPRVLILNQLFDTLPRKNLCAALRVVQSQSNACVVVFSNRSDDLELDYYLYMEDDVQRLYQDFGDFDEARQGSNTGDLRSGALFSDARPQLTHAE